MAETSQILDDLQQPPGTLAPLWSDHLVTMGEHITPPMGGYAAYLTLVSSMPMAAGCEGNLLLEAAGCGLILCQRLPDVSVVVRLGF